MVRPWNFRKSQGQIALDKLRGFAAGRTREALKAATKLHPNGRALLAGGGRPVIPLWDVATLRESPSLKGHTGWISSLAFSPDGQRLASSGNNDQSVRIWSAGARKRGNENEKESGKP